MKKQHVHGKIKLETKRQQELWIYSFADMYMILSVFFISIAMIYAAKAKSASNQTASAGRGLASVESSLSLTFEPGSAAIAAESEESLSLLLPVIKASKALVDVEGYADGSGLRNKIEFSSNLDLSNARAVRVAEWLMKHGVPPRRLRTFSYGDGYQVRKTEDAPTNRRVVVRLLASQNSEPRGDR